MVMKTDPAVVYQQYSEGTSFKSGMGNRGLFEQSRINERFYIGDQWHGAKCGNERPLVRHNVIKRIGDYKMSQILSGPMKVQFSADGIPTYSQQNSISGLSKILNTQAKVSYEADISRIMGNLGSYYDVTAERVNLTGLSEKALKNAYISGSGIIYTYWNPDISTGLFSDSEKNIPIKGDICCEVLNIENVVFGDPYCESVQNQPYIIISSHKNIEEVLREARIHGGDTSQLKSLSEEAMDGKITVYTKLWKKYTSRGEYSVVCSKTTEKNIVRKEFDTALSLYPLTVFCWETKNNIAYGESEITYLIPNQIAINRMITANVWSAMTNGMPIMLVNGDTVTDKITNDPGQIIKVFGSNEDVAGAVKYVSPPSFMKDFDESINALINNTLTQSGANEVALGDSKADNATALITLRDAALMPMKRAKSRFYSFIEELARIWADFWISYYGKRKLKLYDENGISYVDFDSENCKGLIISSKVDVSTSTTYSEKECLDTLLTLFEKGVIDRNQLIMRMPSGIIPDIKGLLEKESEVKENDGK